jgi:hypothetical protein
MERASQERPLKRLRKRTCAKQNKICEQIKLLQLQLAELRPNPNKEKEEMISNLTNQIAILQSRLKDLQSNQKRQNKHREKKREQEQQGIDKSNKCSLTPSMDSNSSESEEEESIAVKLVSVLETPSLFSTFLAQYGGLLQANNAMFKMHMLRSILWKAIASYGQDMARSVMLEYLKIYSVGMSSRRRRCLSSERPRFEANQGNMCEDES